MEKLKAVFFGTPDFSVPALEMLDKHPQIDLVGVVSMPDRPSGRGHKLRSPEVVEYARSSKIKIYQTENINKETEWLEAFKKEEVDLFIVLAFAQFLSQKVLDIPRLGCFNIHTSLLPKYRGAAPIQYALLNGDESTGVSIQKMVKKMDAGDIVWSSPVEVSDNETGGQLYTKLKFQAALSLNDFVNTAIRDELTYTVQDESKVSFAPTLKKEDGLLDFKNSSFEKLHNQIRALDPWPGTYCFLNKKRLKVFSIDKVENSSLGPGKVSTKGFLLIGCKDSVVRLSQVQLEGKKRGTDKDLLNGIKEEVNINPEIL
ncbi:MAG: methionyl-tRNA formyltransferase [Halobacteriovoraceae bacterium]|nr:methionyl-tRNA formyltransferase [Halobacteriovoraceae bacterium]|tara:strand:- start:28312 stop:29256 length:945 start_codon:yes stop_codon:yes gene_type:complete